MARTLRTSYEWKKRAAKDGKVRYYAWSAWGISEERRDKKAERQRARREIRAELEREVLAP